MSLKKYLTKKVELEILNRAEKIKLLGLDVDGVLSDGKIYLSDTYGEEIKAFNTKDGQGIKLAQKHGIRVALITARKSNLVAKRASELGIDFCFQASTNKLSTMENIIQELNLTWQEVAYMGDDLPDMSILKRVGLSATPKDSLSYIKENCHYVCKNKGGAGAVRELIDMILIAQNSLNKILTEYE